MFKFSTTTILNDYSRVSASTSVLKIQKLGNFNANDVTKVFKREGVSGTASYGNLACVGDTNPAADYRLLMYVKANGISTSVLANDMVFHGKPFAYEFSVKASSSAVTAEEVAAAIKKVVDKEFSRFGEKVFEVTPGTGTSAGQNNIAVGTAKIEVAGHYKFYADLTLVELQKYDATTDKYVKVAECLTDPNGDGDTTDSTLKASVAPFGTYEQILKDLRLPTTENLAYHALASDEMPLFGQIYDQYIIYVKKDRGIMGGAAVGQAVTSITAHSIWVKHGDASDFELKLTGLTKADGTTHVALTGYNGKDDLTEGNL